MLDKKLIRFIVFFYFISTTFSVIISIVYVLTSKLADKELNLVDLIITHLFNYGTKFLFIILAIIFTKKYIIDNVSLALSIIIHTFISIILSVYSATLLLLYEKYFLGYSEIEIDTYSIVMRFFRGSDFNFFIYFTLMTFMYAYYYFKKQEFNKLKNSKLKSQMLDSKIKALQSQIQPHFLFNALNDISSLIEINTTKSQDAISDLSEFLRNTLNLSNNKFHSLEDEISLLKMYLKIEKLRYAEKLNIEFDISDKMLKKDIPPLLLQPIVENSIKHGYSYNHDNLTLIVKVFDLNENIGFEIINNGQKINPTGVTFGNGLSNIIERLQTLYSDNFLFEMDNDQNGLVTTKIIIPKVN
nr:histidine kinase [uncultured Psychroserpens sp.]